MPPEKRRKLGVRVPSRHIEPHASGESDPEDSDVREALSASDDEEDSPNTEDEIAQAKFAKSKKTLKRKHRATDSTNFGAALQSLLSTDTPSALPLSLKPSLARKRNDEKLEQKAKKIIQIEKKEKEDIRRIHDVIGGWGGESERALRKVAQRGGEYLLDCVHVWSLMGFVILIYAQWSSCSMLFSSLSMLQLRLSKIPKHLAALENPHYRHQSSKPNPRARKASKRITSLAEAKKVLARVALLHIG